MEFLQSFTWVSAFNTALLVIGALYLAYNKMSVDKRREGDILDDETKENLKTNIASFKDRINFLEEALKKVNEDHQFSLREIARLTGENKAMATLLQGKDELTKEFYQKSIQAMERDNIVYEKFDTFLQRFNLFEAKVTAHIARDEDFYNNVEKLTLERRKNKVKRLKK